MRAGLTCTYKPTHARFPLHNVHIDCARPACVVTEGGADEADDAALTQHDYIAALGNQANDPW